MKTFVFLYQKAWKRDIFIQLMDILFSQSGLQFKIHFKWHLGIDGPISFNDSNRRQHQCPLYTLSISSSGWLIRQINSNKWIGKEECGCKSRLTSATTKCNGKCRQLNRRFNEARPKSSVGLGWQRQKVLQFMQQPQTSTPFMPFRIERLIFIHRLFY